MTHPSDMAVLVERLRALLAKATPGPWHVQAYYTSSGTPDETTRGMVVNDDDYGIGVIDEEISSDPDSLSPNLDLIVETRNALPTLLEALSTDQRTGQEVGAFCELCGVPAGRHEHDCPKSDQYADDQGPAALTKAAPPVEECDLCAGKCRGHSLGRPEQWEPEPGSRAALQQSRAAVPTDLRVRVHTLLATLSADDFKNADIGAAYGEEARELVAALIASPVPVGASGTRDLIDRAALKAKLDELIAAASRQWGAGSTEHNLIRDVSDVVSRVPAALHSVPAAGEKRDAD